MENSAQDLIHLLPYLIRDKARDYLGYVRDRLIDLALEEGVYERVAEIQSEAELIFLLRFLYGYFVVGYQNYEQMLEFFEVKGANGFQIGTTAYTRQSQISDEWRQVSGHLESIVNEAGLALYVRPMLSVDDVLRQVLDSLPNVVTGTEEIG
jgi:hypothetical protein